MSDPQLQTRISELFRNTAAAHHQAFAATDGEDPDWPIWYAEQIKEPMEALVGKEFYLSRLIYCLMDADYEHQARRPDRDWADDYAEHFIECYAPSDAPAEDQLALYYLPTCPFCIRVLRAIDRLGVSVELRNISEDRQFRDELMEARGRATVPVLWIQSPGGAVRWMPESLDIIEYLERTYAGD